MGRLDGKVCGDHGRLREEWAAKRSCSSALSRAPRSVSPTSTGGGPSDRG